MFYIRSQPLGGRKPHHRRHPEGGAGTWGHTGKDASLVRIRLAWGLAIPFHEQPEGWMNVRVPITLDVAAETARCRHSDS